MAIIVLVLRLAMPESPVWLQAREERQRGIHTERAEHASIKDLLKTPYVIPFIAC